MWNCSWGYHFGSGNWLFGHSFVGIVLAVLLAAVLAYVFFLTARLILPGVRPKNTDRNDSLEILKIKYARGEISEQDFVRMREILNG